jgi:hypothetical protein
MTVRLRDVDDYIDAVMDANKEVLEREQIQKINKDIHTYQNSINILVGKQGLGKTFTALREIIKISFADPNVHLLIIINKEGKANDVTFEILKHLFQIPVIFFSYGEAEEQVKLILDYKKLYNTIKQRHLENKIEDAQVEEIFEVLHIDNLARPFLNTVIYFEDCVNNQLFKKPTQYFPQLVAKTRHNGLILFFAAQFWKGLTGELKANANTIYIFRDFSRQQLLYIFQQTPLKHDLYKIYKTYHQLRDHDKLVIDTIKGNITVDRS